MKFQRIKSILFPILLVPVILGLNTIGCGYSFQNTRNPLAEKEGVVKVYVAPLTNDSYKAGIESTIYNDLIRVISAHQRVTLVNNIEGADAILKGTVTLANYGGLAATLVQSLSPSGVGSALPTSTFGINSMYTASLGCSFTLYRRKLSRDPKKTAIIWTSAFTRTKPFPSANQLDVPGTTSPLINDTEFERALVDLSRTMSEDVHEGMLGLF